MAITQSIRQSKGFLPGFQPMLGLVAEAKRRRMIRRSYGEMSLARLYDIGLTQQDVAAALALPLSKNAGEVLARAAAREAARW